jgi:hypothetical protein
MRKEFSYLNRLRDSGVVNMFGAGEYLEMNYEMDRHTARKVLLEWMAWVQDNPSNVEK